MSSACPQTGSSRSSRPLFKPAESRDATTGRGLTVAAAGVFRLHRSASCRRRLLQRISPRSPAFVGTSQILKFSKFSIEISRPRWHLCGVRCEDAGVCAGSLMTRWVLAGVSLKGCCSRFLHSSPRRPLKPAAAASFTKTS